MVSEHSQLQMRPIDAPLYEWKDHSRYVEITPVETGWLIVWGLYEDQGKMKHIHGNRVYREMAGIRRRLADVVMEFTKNPQEAAGALMELERQELPEYRPRPLKRLDG